jgi:hypothetical protein
VDEELVRRRRVRGGLEIRQLLASEPAGGLQQQQQ